MITLTPHYNFLLWLLLKFSPSHILVDQFIEIQREIMAEAEPFERQLHCIFRNKLAGELYRRAVKRNVRYVQVKGVRYQIEPAHIGAIWLRTLDTVSEEL
jgi:hypothetical protein